MISFDINTVYLQDLKDDFLTNEDQDLYEFIDYDPVKAFCLGLKVEEWFEKLESKQKYLYSKQIRHVKDNLTKYSDQIKYWSKQYPDKDNDEIDLVNLSEYIFNNMFWDQETEELDMVNLAFFFGSTVHSQQKKDEFDR